MSETLEEFVARALGQPLTSSQRVICRAIASGRVPIIPPRSGRTAMAAAIDEWCRIHRPQPTKDTP